MTDLESAIFTLLSWFLYVGIVCSIGAVISSLLLFSQGNSTTAKKLLTAGIAGVLLGVSANQIFQALISGISLGSSADLVTKAVVASLIVCSVLYFGLGRREEGINYAAAAAIAAGFIALIPAIQTLFASSTIDLAGTCVLEANVTPANPRAGEPATFQVSMPYGSGAYTLTAIFGDGGSATSSISPGGEVSFQHVYENPGTYGVLIYARGNGSCYYALGVNVGEPPSPWFLGPFDLTGFSSRINSLLKVPLNLFYWAPEFDLSSSGEDMKLYMAVTSVAMAALGLFLAIRIVSRFLERDPSSSVVDSVKEAVLVLAVVLLAPYLYQTFAHLCNQASSVVIDRINLAGSILSLVGLVAASAILGVVSSFAGTLGSVLVYSFMLSSFAAALRYALIKSLVYCAPLLAVAYLFPAARGAVKFFMNVLAGLVLAGPVAAFILAGLSNLNGPAGQVAAAFAPALSYLAFPIFLSMASGASPGMAAQGIARLTAGAIAGFRGPSTLVEMAGQLQTVPGTGGTQVTPGSQRKGFVSPAHYATHFDRDTHALVSSPTSSQERMSPGSPAHDRPVQPGFPAQGSVQPRFPSQPGAQQGVQRGAQQIPQDVEAQPDIQAQPAQTQPSQTQPSGKPSIIGRVQGAYRKLEDWYGRSVFKQKIYPRWMRIAGKFGGWGGYGHHVVLGHIHPYAYKNMRDEIRAYRTSFMERRVFTAQTSQLHDLESEMEDYTGGGPF